MIISEVTKYAHRTAALLSLYILVIDYASEIPIMLAQCFSNWSSVAHLLVAMILASRELNAVWYLCIDLHAIGPPEKQMKKPEIERDLNSSRGVPSSSALPNRPNQLVL